MKVPNPAYVMRMNAEAARFAGVPEELDKIADVALNYRPKNKQKKAKRRKKRKAKRNV